MSDLQEEASRKKPVIVNSTLDKSAVAALLHRQHRVRLSSTTVSDTCIFPCSGLTFKIVTLSDISIDKIHQLYDSLEKLLKIHKQSFVICVSPMHGQKEFALIQNIQMRFITTSLQLVLVHNAPEVVSFMNQATLVNLKSRKYTASEEDFLSLEEEDLLCRESEKSAVMTTGVSAPEAIMLLEQFGSLADLMQASEEMLIKCGLNRKSAKQVFTFFQNDAL